MTTTQEIKQAINDYVSTLKNALIEFIDADGFYVRNNDTDFCGVPTGYIEGVNVVAFIKEWQLEIEGVDGNELTLSAEWGDGTGKDTFTISLK